VSATRDSESLVHVAKLYYRENLSQAEIAKRLGTSRSNVSRMLTAAQDRYIVEIRIHERAPRDLALEEQLTRRFGLRQAIVASRDNDISLRPLQRVGDLVWTWLAEQLGESSTIAMSWGEALQAFVASVTPQVMSSTEVVQLIGGVSARASLVTGQELVREFATRIGASYRYLHAPAAFQSVRARLSLMQEPSIVKALDAARRADVAVVGVGSVSSGSSAAILHAVHANRRELGEFHRAGPVGDIAGRYFDAGGRAIHGAIDDRVLAPSLEDIAAIPTVVALAAGDDKVVALHGALQGRLIDVLGCDASAADGILALAGD
jgi:DNA-binding transcriptional regulator LsrR (DeoR family)